MPDLHALLLQNIGTILTGLASLAAVLALMWLKKHFVTWKAYDGRLRKVDAHLADHDAKITIQSERLASVEGATSTITDALAKLPQREDLLTLEIGLTELRGGLREVNASMHGLKDLVERQEAQTTLLHEHLLSVSK